MAHVSGRRFHPSARQAPSWAGSLAPERSHPTDDVAQAPLKPRKLAAHLAAKPPVWPSGRLTGRCKLSARRKWAARRALGGSGRP